MCPGSRNQDYRAGFSTWRFTLSFVERPLWKHSQKIHSKSLSEMHGVIQSLRPRLLISLLLNHSRTMAVQTSGVITRRRFTPRHPARKMSGAVACFNCYQLAEQFVQAFDKSHRARVQLLGVGVTACALCTFKYTRFQLVPRYLGMMRLNVFLKRVSNTRIMKMKGVTTSTRRVALLFVTYLGFDITVWYFFFWYKIWK